MLSCYISNTTLLETFRVLYISLALRNLASENLADNDPAITPYVTVIPRLFAVPGGTGFGGQKPRIIKVAKDFPQSCSS